jgi:hypothetical protein
MASLSTTSSQTLAAALGLIPRKSKYGNKPQQIGAEKYRSKREARRHLKLLALQRAGLVANLRREIAYVLAPSVRFASKRRATPELRYMADFVYTDTRTGHEVVEDCKGCRTEGYRIKRHLMLAVHGIEVRES